MQSNNNNNNNSSSSSSSSIDLPYQTELNKINQTIGDLTDVESLARFFSFVTQQYLDDRFNSNWYLAGINYLLRQMRRPMNGVYTLDTLIEVT